jgi:hypothetical protein
MTGTIAAASLAAVTRRAGTNSMSPASRYTDTGRQFDALPLNSATPRSMSSARAS